MVEAMASHTSPVNGRLWGASAKDWSEIQEYKVQPVYAEALSRLDVGPGTRLLDVGCGSGLAAWMAAERGAIVTGLDAAETLIAIAGDRVPYGDFRVGELEALPYVDGFFDIVTGFNSFQYAGNPTKALSEARRVVKPSGSVLVMTWGRPEGMQAASLIAALRPLLPTPPAGAPGPFALSDEGALRAFAESAGLAPAEVFDVRSPWHYDSLEIGLRALRSTGVAARAIDHSGAEAVEKAHADALAPFLQPDGSYLIDATFRCLVAKAPPR